MLSHPDLSLHAIIIREQYVQHIPSIIVNSRLTLSRFQPVHYFSFFGIQYCFVPSSFSMFRINQIVKPQLLSHLVFNQPPSNVTFPGTNPILLNFILHSGSPVSLDQGLRCIPNLNVSSAHSVWLNLLNYGFELIYHNHCSKTWKYTSILAWLRHFCTSQSCLIIASRCIFQSTSSQHPHIFPN
jgi:hypothetical protein